MNQERQSYTRRADGEHVRHDGCLIEAVDRQRVSTDAEFKAQLSAERANCLCPTGGVLWQLQDVTMRI